ncbi:MAG: hypothetical protein JSW06_01985 [Thermoplasmatales archaeon]|nr:MAG: hypothetical protein JSW06_01985 [Thermoplasmatales archaeon]
MNNLIKKGVVVSVILLFISVSVIPSTGNTVIEKHVSTENFPSDDSVIMKSGLSLITIKVEGEIGENEWYVSDVTFTITYESDEIAAIYYRFNSGEWTEYTESFIASDDGEHILEWYAVDYEGNQSEVDGPFDFKIDQTVPMVDLTWESPDNIHVVFTAFCSDGTSGMDYVEFYLNDGLMFTDNEVPYEWTIVWSPSLKTAVFKATAYDKAGNSDSDSPTGIGSSMIFAGIDELGSHRNTQNIVKSTEIVGREKHETGEKLLLDCSRGGDTKPAYVIVVVNKKMGKNDWAVSDVSFSMIPDPDGIDVVYSKLDEEDWLLYNEPIVISQDGAHTLSWYIVDIEGYMSTPESISFKIDQTPPEINLIKNKVGFNEIEFTADVRDETSGIEKVEFYTGRYLNLEYTDYDFPYEWTWKGLGNVKVTVIVYDNAGNCNSSLIKRWSTYSQHINNLWLLDRFPLLNQLIMRLVESWI